MKKITKTIALFLTLCLTASFAMFTAGCGDPDKDECNHENVIVCEQCGEVVLGDDFFVNYIKSGWNTIGAGKGYDLELNARAELPREYLLAYIGENGRTYKTIKKVTMEIEDASLFVGFDAQSQLYVEGEFSLLAKTFDESEQVFTLGVLTVEDISLNGTMFSCVSSQATTYPSLSEELQELNKLEIAPTSNEIDLSAIAGEGSVVDMLLQALPMVVECYDEILIPYGEGVLDVNKEEVNLSVAKAIDSLFTVEKDGNYYKFTMDALATEIKNTYALLDSDLPIFVDALFGAGTYENLPERIDQILDLKIADLLNKLEEKGITIDGLIALGDQVIRKLSGDDQITLEQFLSAQFGMEINIREYVDLLKENTLRQILIALAKVTDEDINTFIAQLDVYLEQLKDYSIIDLMLPVGANPEVKEMIKEVVDVSADFIDEMIDAEIVMDKNGSIISGTCSIAFDAQKPKAQAFYEKLESIGATIDQDSINGYVFEASIKVTAAQIPVA